MTLQTSGAIKFSEIQTEFGGSNPISLSEYYAGGSYVPSGTSGTNGAVPSSGSVSMSKYYGTSPVLITISDDSISAFKVFSGAATARYTLGADGNIFETINGQAATDIGDWIVPKSAAGSNYEVYATLSSGTLFSGTTGSWLNLGSSQSWAVTRSGSAGTTTAVVVLQIRRVGTTTVLDTATITLEATFEP